MRDLITPLFISSAAISLLVILLKAATPFLTRRFSAKWIYYAWFAVVLGLLIPARPKPIHDAVSFSIPAKQAVVTVPQSALENESEITALTFGSPSNGFIVIGGFSIWDILAFVWAFGAFVFVGLHTARHIQFIKITKRWSRNGANTVVCGILDKLCAEMGISAKIRVRICPCADSPAMTGLIRPMLLLPESVCADGVSQGDLRFIIKHELVHYKKRDLLIKELTLAAWALHWFNPVMLLVSREINTYCEISCDAEVVNGEDTDARAAYSEALLNAVRRRPVLKTALSTNFNNGKSGVKKRVLLIMEENRKKAGTAVAFLTLTAVFFAGSVTCSALENEKNEIRFHIERIETNKAVCVGKIELFPGETYILEAESESGGDFCAVLNKAADNTNRSVWWRHTPTANEAARRIDAVFNQELEGVYYVYIISPSEELINVSGRIVKSGPGPDAPGELAVINEPLSEMIYNAVYDNNLSQLIVRNYGKVSSLSAQPVFIPFISSGTED